MNLNLCMRLLALLFFSLPWSSTFGQSAIIEVKGPQYPEQYEHFDEIAFSFNGVSFSGADLGTHQIPLKKDLDAGFAVLNGDTLPFFLKLRDQQVYVLEPGCCCAAYSLKAEKDAHRGVVRLHNKTDRPLRLLVSESNSDSVPAHDSRPPIFAFESAMCLFKPASIFLADHSYAPYSEIAPEKLEQLSAEEKQLRNTILSRSWFHFLHGEKVSLHYSGKKQAPTFHLDGYLTVEEIEAYHSGEK